jgi:hypothetical protein
MKLAIAAVLAGSAAAFAPTAQNSASVNSALSMAFESEIGAQAPLGFYDPAGLLKDADQERFDRLRYVELKHGRVSQLAFLGYLTTWEGIRLPGFLSPSDNLRFSDVPGGAAALKGIPLAGMTQLFFFVGFLELAVWKQNEGSFPGDFSGSPLFPVGWVGDNTEEEKVELRAKELNQGRAAMMGILALMVHEQLDGTPFIFFQPGAGGAVL